MGTSRVASYSVRTLTIHVAMAVETESSLEIPIAEEIEVKTTQRRKRKVTTVATNQANKKKKPAKANSASHKRKPKSTRALTKAQRSRVADISKEEVLVYVVSRVPGELISDLFPDRLKLWEFLTGDPERLQHLVEFATNKHMELYHECSTERSKCSELFLQWLDFVRSITCVSEHTPETMDLLHKVLDNSGAGLETTMTVLAVILNAVYMGVHKQMAKMVENISMETSTSTEPVLPDSQLSDDTSLHRICGWALKSTIDQVTKQLRLKPTSTDLEGKNVLLQALKLPHSEKSCLPAAVQYLDRGGLTFMRIPFTQWMKGLEEKITSLLNQKNYAIYGAKIFEVHACTLILFKHGVYNY